MCTVCGCGSGENPDRRARWRTPQQAARTRSPGATRAWRPLGEPHAAGYRPPPRTQPPSDPGHWAAPDTAPRPPSPPRLRQRPGARPRAGLSQAQMLRIERDILGKNDARAAENRAWLAARGIFALNLVSSPGSGKTSLLVRTLQLLGGRVPAAVIEGDQQTEFDAERIRATGVPALQINTGKGCHLDADMVARALPRMELVEDSLLLIENVGNLVCPAAFDLGEAHKVAILSVTEGEDKPLKYPDMFAAADLMLLNKVDLLPYLAFDAGRAIDFALRVNPRLRVLRTSATTGEGLDEWIAWIEAGLAAARAACRGCARVSAATFPAAGMEASRPLHARRSRLPPTGESLSLPPVERFTRARRSTAHPRPRRVVQARRLPARGRARAIRPQPGRPRQRRRLPQRWSRPPRPCSRRRTAACARSPTTSTPTSTPPASPAALAARAGRAGDRRAAPPRPRRRGARRAWPLRRAPGARPGARRRRPRHRRRGLGRRAAVGGGRASSCVSATCARCACPAATAPRASPGAWPPRSCTPAAAATRSRTASPGSRRPRCSPRCSPARRCARRPPASAATSTPPPACSACAR